jgi:hypothetical protein
LQEEEQCIRIKDAKKSFIISAKTPKNQFKEIPATSVSHADMKRNNFLILNQDKDELQTTQLFVVDNIYN